MQNILLVIHLLLALLLIGAVLLQRSEGGALGIGGGGNVMSGRGAATALQKATWGLAAAFVVTSMTLTFFAIEQSRDRGLGLGEAAPAVEGGETPAAAEGGLLDLSAGGAEGATPAAQTETPPATSAPDATTDGGAAPADAAPEGEPSPFDLPPASGPGR